MAEYIDVERARAMSGLRLVLTPGVPGPWSEAAKGVLYVKKLPYVKVRQELGGENRALLEWTAQASAPVMAWNEEWPRSLWNDQLYLAERLQPDPPLVPANLEDRVLMFGYANEICGVNGFGWSTRVMIIRDGLGNPDPAGRQQIASASFAQPPPSSVPPGLRRLASIWTAPFPAYAPPFLRSASFGYLLSATFGAGLILLMAVGADRVLSGRRGSG